MNKLFKEWVAIGEEFSHLPNGKKRDKLWKKWKKKYHEISMALKPSEIQKLSNDDEGGPI